MIRPAAFLVLALVLLAGDARPLAAQTPASSSSSTRIRPTSASPTRPSSSSSSSPATARELTEDERAAAVGLGVGGLACVGVCVVLGLVLTLVPAFIAFGRGHPNAVAITAVSLLLGWTFLGWVAALVWSLTAIDRRRYR